MDGEYSEGEIDLFRQIVRRGMVVLDIGANIGVFTVYLATAVGSSGRVYSFEPQRALYHVLCGNLALNAFGNLTAVHGALGSRADSIFVPMRITERTETSGALGSKRNGAPGFWARMSACRPSMRWLSRNAISSRSMWKGWSGEVLAGATETLARCRPLLYVENDRREKSPELISSLLERDYRLFWHLPRLFNPNNHFGEKHDVFPGVISINMLGVPLRDERARRLARDRLA
jgi:FkbM family methyltransferase